MPTASRLIDETIGLLQGQSQDVSQYTTLAGAMSPTDLTFTVTAYRAGQMGISPGVVEIGSELVYVSGIDPSSMVATIAPWGRGYNQTTPAVHNPGERITSQPAFPRYWVLDALNQAILRVYPQLFYPRVAKFTTTSPSQTYDLPDDAGWVLDARWQPPSASKSWNAIRRWRMSAGGYGTPDLGVSVDVADDVYPGFPIEFTYAAKPQPMANETDDYVTTTGLSLSTKDLIVTGAACGSLTTSQELSRLQTSSIEQQNRAGLVAPSAALTSSRFLEAKFQQRLEEESRNLRRLYPPRISRSWV